MDLKFGKAKKLKSRKRIEHLFSDGKRISKFPLTAVYYLDRNHTPGFKVAFSVPKKKIKKAVDRNLIKRRIRETFRLNQNKLKTDFGLEIMFIYGTSEPLKYQVIEKSMLLLIDSLNLVSTDDTSA